MKPGRNMHNVETQSGHGAGSAPLTPASGPSGHACLSRLLLCVSNDVQVIEDVLHADLEVQKRLQDEVQRHLQSITEHTEHLETMKDLVQPNLACLSSDVQVIEEVLHADLEVQKRIHDAVQRHLRPITECMKPLEETIKKQEASDAQVTKGLCLHLELQKWLHDEVERYLQPIIEDMERLEKIIKMQSTSDVQITEVLNLHLKVEKRLHEVQRQLEPITEFTKHLEKIIKMQSASAVQVKEVLCLQVEVQERLHEVQRHLQPVIESRKQLEKIIEMSSAHAHFSSDVQVTKKVLHADLAVRKRLYDGVPRHLEPITGHVKHLEIIKMQSAHTHLSSDVQVTKEVLCGDLEVWKRLRDEVYTLWPFQVIATHTERLETGRLQSIIASLSRGLSSDVQVTEVLHADLEVRERLCYKVKVHLRPITNHAEHLEIIKIRSTHTRLSSDWQVTQALHLQLEAQKRSHEVQRQLQLRVEEHGKYLEQIIKMQSFKIVPKDISEQKQGNSGLAKEKACCSTMQSSSSLSTSKDSDDQSGSSGTTFKLNHGRSSLTVLERGEDTAGLGRTETSLMRFLQSRKQRKEAILDPGVHHIPVEGTTHLIEPGLTLASSPRKTGVLAGLDELVLLAARASPGLHTFPLEDATACFMGPDSTLASSFSSALAGPEVAGSAHVSEISDSAHAPHLLTSHLWGSMRGISGSMSPALLAAQSGVTLEQPIRDDDAFSSGGTQPTSNSTTIDEKSIERDSEAGNENFPIRSNIQILGFTSWDQNFDSHNILLLCQLQPVEREAHIIFFHAEALASLFGIEVAFSKLSITFPEQADYEIRVEEMTEETWKSYWVSSCQDVWKPLLCKRKNTDSRVTTKSVYSMSREEALSNFGICLDGIEDQTFVNLGSSTSDNLEDAFSVQPRWIRWFADMVEHIQRAQHHDDTKLSHDNDLHVLDKRLWHNLLYSDESYDCADRTSLCESEGDAHVSGDSSNQPLYERQGVNSDELFQTATQGFDTNYIKLPCKADLVCNHKGPGSSEGMDCRGNVQELTDPCEQQQPKRRCSRVGDNSSDGRAVPELGVKARARKGKKSLKVNVRFLHKDCNLYRRENGTGARLIAPVDGRMPQSSIRPTFSVEFLYDPRQPGDTNHMNITLGAEYLFSNQKIDCDDRWYQDKFRLSFGHSEDGNLDVPSPCDVLSHRIVSDVVYEEWESTTQSGSEQRDLKETSTNGSVQSEFRWLPFGGSISRGRRGETTMQKNCSKQLINKVKPCCLADNRSIAIKPALKSGTLRYEAYSLHEPVMPDNPQWKVMQATGLYSDVKMTVTGKWLLIGDKKESYKITAKKVLSKHLGGGGATADGGAGARGGPTAGGRNNLPGGSNNVVGGGDEAERPLWQTFTRRFVLNHNFSEFFETLKKPDPYDWVLIDSSNNSNPVPQAIQVSAPVPLAGLP